MLRRVPAAVESVLGPPRRREALAEEIGFFPKRMRERGRAYAYDGRVSGVRLDPNDSIAATVVGTQDYVATWYWDGSGWEHGCTCPIGYECKHAYALGEVLLAAPATSVTRQVPASPAAVRGDDLDARLLKQLLGAAGPWERRRPFEALLATCDDPLATVLDPRFTEILHEPDPEILCWRLAGAIAAVAGVQKVPDVLRPYVTRTDLEQEFAARARNALGHLLRRWTEQRALVGKKQLRFVVNISFKPRVTFVIEPRLSSARLKDEPRSVQQLALLSAEAARDPEVLSPQEAEALDLFLADTSHSMGFSAGISVDPDLLFDLSLRQAPRTLLYWADDLRPEVTAQTGVEPGSPVRCEHVPIRLQPEVYGEGARVMLGLYAAWPDGRRRRFEKSLLVEPSRDPGRGQPLLLAEGAVWPVIEMPPAEVIEGFAAAGAVEIPEVERAATLPRLAASFANIAATLSLHARRVATEPLVVLELRRDDWLQVRLFARERGSHWTPAVGLAADSRVFERAADGRWLPATATTASEANQAAVELPAEADAGDVAPALAPAAENAPADAEPAPTVGDDDVWLEVPDPSALAPVLEWLAKIGACPLDEWRTRRRVPSEPDVGNCLWLRIDEDTLEEFVAAWAEKPRAVYFGNPRLRRVLMGGEAIRTKVKVEASGTDWFSVSASWASEGLALSEADMAQLRAAKKTFVRLPSGWVRREAIAAQDEAATLLADLGIEVGVGEQRVTMWQLAGARAASVAALEAMGADAGAVKALNRLRKRVTEFQGIPEVPVPASLQAELRPYQCRGLDFLCYTAELGLGAILADDMGLGKTLQTLAWLTWLKQKRRGRGTALVVCPTSVAPNWVREAERFAPDLKVLLLGRGRERLQERKQWRDYDLIITNYALLRRDEDFWTDIKLRAIILDEAQNIKNPDAAVARAARALNADYRLALTGTPLENRPLDLWSLVEFVNPGCLGRRSDFTARFDRADLPAHQRQVLAAKLRPILLRRLKRDVAAELPERIEERLDCELTPGQRKFYLAELRRSRTLVDRVAGDADGLRRNKIEVLAALTRLRQVCCHPALVGGEVGLGSGKFEALFELLETLLGEGHKVLVFSQFVRCLDLIALELQRRNMPQHLLTGQSTNREKIVRDFQEDEAASVFLISLRAGGTGLNLTAASYVVLFDPWWNPAVEAQAIDRTHRIGQDKTVIAYRLVASGTVEEKIFELQQRKAALARDLLGEDGFARSLSRDDLDFLLNES